jgi:3-dehydroquinate synthase II
MPGDKTRYLEELAAGSEVLVVSHQGATKNRRGRTGQDRNRPMLLFHRPGRRQGRQGLFAKATPKPSGWWPRDGKPVSVVTLKEGDQVLVRTGRGRPPFRHAHHPKTSRKVEQ